VQTVAQNTITVLKKLQNYISLMGLGIERKGLKRELQLPIANFFNRQWAIGNWKWFLLLVAELVANTPDSQDHLRVFGVLFDLGSQAINV
jgi:hypothetical protein